MILLRFLIDVWVLAPPILYHVTKGQYWPLRISDLETCHVVQSVMSLFESMAATLIPAEIIHKPSEKQKVYTCAHPQPRYRQTRSNTKLKVVVLNKVYMCTSILRPSYKPPISERFQITHMPSNESGCVPMSIWSGLWCALTNFGTGTYDPNTSRKLKTKLYMYASLGFLSPRLILHTTKHPYPF